MLIPSGSSSSDGLGLALGNEGLSWILKVINFLMLIPSGSSSSDGLGWALGNEGLNWILKVINFLMLIPSGSSSSSSSDGLCVFSSANSFLRSLPCFSKGTIPQYIDGEDGWREFNESMHSRYGYSRLPEFPLKIVTKTVLRSSKIFIITSLTRAVSGWQKSGSIY